jgi:sulfotransferase family protein
VSGVVERLEKFNPDARFIYVLRDPVERTLSHYWHMVRYHDEQRPIIRAIKQDSQYIAVSYYAMQLKPYLERFGRDQIKILTYENLVRSPAVSMRGLYGWLGVSAYGVDMSGFVEPENVTPDIVRQSLAAACCDGCGNPRAFVVSSGAFLDRSRRHCAEPPIGTYLGRRSTRPMPSHSCALSSAGKTEELEQLLGREFPEWTTLKG